MIKNNGELAWEKTKMLLAMSNVELNRQCSLNLIKQYSLGQLIVYPEQLIGESVKLCIVDVACTENIYLKMSGKDFADQLIQMDLPLGIRDIYMIMSDVNPDKSLMAFCNDLAKAFAQCFHRKIAVHAPVQLGYDMTILMPTKSGKWQIYGLYDNGMIANKLLKEKTHLDFDYIKTLSDKVLLWEGTDIQKYLDDPQKIYDGISYVWSY